MSHDTPPASGAGATPPVCPRHPDRVSYVRCQRCDRPTCPDCQVPGSVGIHCVDCVRSASQRRRPTRTVLGGVAVEDARITTGLIAACVVVYVIQMVRPSLAVDLGFAPVVALSEPWRFLSTAFLHGSLMHLAFNMWALWVCGSTLEPLMGRWRFAALCLLSALGGSTAIYLLASPGSAAWRTLTVGASGAVFGLFAAVFVIQRRFGRDTSAILGLLAVNLVISFLGAGISWQGHLGGLLIGLAVASLFTSTRRRRGPVAVWGCLAVALVLGALIAAKDLLV